MRMIIDSSGRPVPPLNGDVSLTSTQGPGHHEELDLDYLDWSRDAQGRICLHCFDTGRNTVVVRIRESLIEEIMFPGSGLHTSHVPPDWKEGTNGG